MRLFLIDDHTLFRSSLSSLLNAEDGIQVIGEASSGREALQRLGCLMPDLIVVDIGLQDMSGFDLVPAIRTACPGARIVFLTASDLPEDVRRAASLQAEGYLQKNMQPDQFLTYLREIGWGARRVAPDVAAALFAGLTHQAAAEVPPEKPGISPEELTSREFQILELLRSGLRNKEIAQRLFITENTVKNHLKTIYGKLGVENRLQAVDIAGKRRLLQ